MVASQGHREVLHEGGPLSRTQGATAMFSSSPDGPGSLCCTPPTARCAQPPRLERAFGTLYQCGLPGIRHTRQPHQTQPRSA